MATVLSDKKGTQQFIFWGSIGLLVVALLSGVLAQPRSGLKDAATVLAIVTAS